MVMARLNVGEQAELAARLADTHPETGKPYFAKGNLAQVLLQIAGLRFQVSGFTFRFQASGSGSVPTNCEDTPVCRVFIQKALG